MTDDKEDKTLEHQEHFTEVAKSRDVEVNFLVQPNLFMHVFCTRDSNLMLLLFQVLEGKAQFVEFAGNLVPVTKSGEQLQLGFRGFRENRLAFTVRVKDPHADPIGRILFMKEAKASIQFRHFEDCVFFYLMSYTFRRQTMDCSPNLA